MSPNFVGWVASTILISTLINQIYTQLKQETLRGVSRWLFLGQIASSVGFIAYSWMLDNWVFVTTNFLILLTALTGQLIFWWRERGSRRKASRVGST